MTEEKEFEDLHELEKRLKGEETIVGISMEEAQQWIELGVPFSREEED